jgi:hypothetical protein
MIRILPEWYCQERKKLEDLVKDISVRQNLNYRFVFDSFAIKEAIDIIMNTLERIKRESIPYISDEEIANWNKLGKTLKKAKRK